MPSPPPPPPLPLNPVSPKTDQHQFSPNNTNTLLREKVIRVNEINDHQREIALSFYQIHSTDSLRIQMYMCGICTVCKRLTRNLNPYCRMPVQISFFWFFIQEMQSCWLYLQLLVMITTSLAEGTWLCTIFCRLSSQLSLCFVYQGYSGT